MMCRLSSFGAESRENNRQIVGEMANMQTGCLCHRRTDP